MAVKHTSDAGESQPHKESLEKRKTVTLLSWEEILDRITDLEARLDKVEAADELHALGWDSERRALREEAEA